MSLGSQAKGYRYRKAPQASGFQAKRGDEARSGGGVMESVRVDVRASGGIDLAVACSPFLSLLLWWIVGYVGPATAAT